MKYKYTLVVLWLVAVPAFGHTRLKIKTSSDTSTPASHFPPRNDSTGLKTGPCGGLPRTSTPVTYKAGSTQTVEWEETIDHPGFFIISLSEKDDANFEAHVLISHRTDDKNTPISSGTPGHFYSESITLPNITCTACTLQIIQVMGDEGASRYFSCSDVILVNDPEAPPADPTTPPSPEGTPAPDGAATPATPAPGGKPNNTNVKPSKPYGVKVQKNK